MCSTTWNAVIDVERGGLKGFGQIVASVQTAGMRSVRLTYSTASGTKSMPCTS